MKRRFFGIYGKVFFFTLLNLFIVILVMFFFFFDQIKSVVEQTQREQIANAFQPLLTQLKGKSNEEIVAIAKRFHEKNTLFEFGVEASDGRILYKTKGFTMPAKDIRIPPLHKPIARGYSPMVGKFSFITHTSGERFQFMTLVPGGTRLYMSGTISGMAVYDEFIEKTVIAFVLILLASRLLTYLQINRGLKLWALLGKTRLKSEKI